MNVQATTANKVNMITGITNSVGTAWATPTYDGAGNMIGVPNPPVTITGTTPAWVPMTEAQWNMLYETQWNTLMENTGTPPKALSEASIKQRLPLETSTLRSQQALMNFLVAAIGEKYKFREDSASFLA